ncbi:hypothetical protein GCM10010404_17320 [Nonomuraea africana]
MPTLDQQVRCHYNTPVGCFHHRGVVTGTEQHALPLWQSSGDTCYNSEFAEISDCDDAPPVGTQGTVALRR